MCALRGQMSLQYAMVTHSRTVGKHFLKGIAMSDERIKRFLLYAASVASAAALLYVTLRYLLVWLLPFLLAAALAAVIDPAVHGMQTRLHVRRSFASLVLTLFLLFALGGLLSLLGTTLTGEAYALLRRAPDLLAAVPGTLRTLLARLERYASVCPPWLREVIESSLTRSFTDAGELLGTLANQMLSTLGSAATMLPKLFLAAATSVLAIYFTSSAAPEFRRYFAKHADSELQRKLRRVQDGFKRSVARWLRAELTLCAVTFTELLAGFLFLRQPYALLLAFLITLVDALPVFGTGTVLLPWALAAMLLQNMPKAICLLLLYFITLVVRNILEPRLLGAIAGVPPILSLLAMYLGFCTFGVAGMVLFPFLLLLGMQLWRAS